MWNQSPDNDISSDLSTLVDDLTHLDLQKSSLCSTTTITSPTTSVASSAEVEVDEATTLLNSISSYFFVQPTKYGGRGCFANSDLAQGTIVHECSMPLSSIIARPFRKEVCGSCFKFLHGLNQCQYDLERKKQQEEAEIEAELKLENELKQAKNIELFISQKWQEAEINCQLQLSKLKPKQ
ncbi:unnamed protein product, partial [Rotaria sp. Silwood1]